MARSVKWDLIADPTRFNRGFDRAAQRTDRFHKQVANTARLIGGAFAAVQVAGFLKDAIDEAREAQKVGKQTAAVIKATGGVAKVSALDVDRLADSLSRKAAVDDELIASGANLLLTFKGVRNEAGKGNRIFDEASSAILDMTAAMNHGAISQEGLKASTILVGKALNDPIRGLTALTRVGVTFTEGQRKQIKAMVAAGDTMGAQKIILGELKSEFGGAAAAAADPWKRVVVALDNVKERLGGVLLPLIDKASKFIVDKAIPAVDAWWKKFKNDFTPQIDRLKKAWDDNKASFLALLTTFAGGEAQIGDTKNQAKALGDALNTIVVNAGKVARFLTTAGAVMDKVATQVNILGLETHKGFQRMALSALNGLKAALNLGIGFGKLLNAASRLSGGSGKVADSMIADFRGMRDSVDTDMTRIRGDLATTQRKIDTLHGKKNIPITVRTDVGISRNARLALRAAGFKGQLPSEFAVGGAVTGPGGPTADRVPAMLSAGEHVWTAAEVQAAGGHGAVESMRREVRGMADGGAVGRGLDRVMTGTSFATTRWGRTVIDSLAGKLGRALAKAIEKGMAGGSAGIRAFIRAADRLPYVWGAAGPAAYDCSGLVGAVYGKMRGDPRAGRGRRYFTTATVGGAPGLKSGLGGLLNIGVTAGSGHMAGSYGGLGFEARSTRTGIFTGRAARSPSSFARRYHMATGGPVVALAGRLAGVPGVDVAGDPSRLTLVAGRFRGFDSGGWLEPGMTVAMNGTGRSEPVGFDYDAMADAFVRALQRHPPTVAVGEVHTALLARKRGRGGVPLGLS